MKSSMSSSSSSPTDVVWTRGSGTVSDRLTPQATQWAKDRTVALIVRRSRRRGAGLLRPRTQNPQRFHEFKKTKIKDVAETKRMLNRGANWDNWQSNKRMHFICKNRPIPRLPTVCCSALKHVQSDVTDLNWTNAIRLIFWQTYKWANSNALQ